MRSSLLQADHMTKCQAGCDGAEATTAVEQYQIEILPSAETCPADFEALTLLGWGD